MHIPHTVQVWGIVSFILLQVFHNLLTDKRKATPHFLFLQTGILELDAEKKEIQKKHSNHHTYLKSNLHSAIMQILQEFIKTQTLIIG